MPHTVAGLRQARQGRITGVKGKGGTERTVFLSADARQALADYLEKERPRDAGEGDAGALPDGDGDPGAAQPTAGSRCGRST